jgi:hypothetical protein
MNFNLVSKHVTTRKVSLPAMETTAGEGSLLGTIMIFCMIKIDDSYD